MNFKKNTTLSHYKILSEIGKGGMGEVYLAEDTKLNRQVALKILPADFANDAERMSRFVREAQSASALNHPNIITIYEINEIDDLHFISTEYIKGKTLNDYISADSLKFSGILDIAIQVASALDEAHAAGIVHRDIKPDNIMVRENGLVKILDFGIAKLVGFGNSDLEIGIAEDDKTLIQSNNPKSPIPNPQSTLPGMIIGTANYMSPEQAKGQEVDVRTDIFSFGVVLYEMIAGHLPFEGESPLEMIGSILNKEPKPLSDSEVPADLRKIIGKSLRKDRDERYQTIKGLLADLKEVKRELEFQDKLEGTIQPNKEEDQQQTQILQATTATEQKQTANITGETKRKLPKWLMASGVIGLVGIAVFAGWYFLAGGLFSKETPFAKIKVEEITSAPAILSPVISPDGKFIAYVKAVFDSYVEKKSLIVRQTGSGAENVIFEVPESDLELKTFSSDGEFIYFLREARDDQSGLYRISALGGSPKKILDGNIRDAYVSPDGKEIAYSKRDDSNQIVFYLADINGSNSEEILKLQDIDATDIELGPWHPDGTKLLFEINKNIDSKGFQGSVATLDVSDKDLSPKDRVQILYTEMGFNQLKSAWTPDGNGVMLLVWKPQELTTDQLWHLSYPEGKIRQVTDDFNDYRDFSLSADGKSIIGITSSDQNSIWSVDPETKKVRQIIPESKDTDDLSLSSTPDGKVYYFKRVKNGSAIYSNALEGGDEKELFTIPGRVRQFKTDTDGKYIVASITSSKLPSRYLVLFDIDGSNRTQLTNKELVYDQEPQITKEGYILFRRRYFADEKPAEIMKIPIGGGESEKIDLGPSDGDYAPRLSPDGKYLAYVQRIEDKTTGKRKEIIRIVEFSDGKPGKLVLEKDLIVPRIRWTPESDAIIYEKQKERSNLFKLTLSGQTETQISDFNLRADTGDFTWTPDGKRILAFRSTYSANLVLIKDVTTDEK